MAKFQKGQTANPNGRPKAVTLDELRNIARRKAPGMVDLLVKIAEDEEQAGAARVSAANHVLDRAYGKPAQMLGDENGDAMNWVDLIAEARRRRGPDA